MLHEKGRTISLLWYIWSREKRTLLKKNLLKNEHATSVYTKILKYTFYRYMPYFIN